VLHVGGNLVIHAVPSDARTHVVTYVLSCVLFCRARLTWYALVWA
jgi:hypothetical protein